MIEQNELEYIRLIFQLHKLNLEENEEQAEVVRQKMDIIEKETCCKKLHIISSWCYAITEKQYYLKNKYKKLLFDGTWDS